MSHERAPTSTSASETADARPRSRWGDALWIAALVAGTAVVWDARVVHAPDAKYLFTSGDAFGYFLPAYEYEARRLASGSFPFWNPYQGTGVPFLATLQ